MLDDQRDDGPGGGARPAIGLSGLTKQYRRGQGWFTAVNDVTLTVPAGQVIGLLGPNGAGKTTTIKMACGLILPTAGTIRINGYDVGRQRASAVRQIGAVLEGSRNVYWPLTAWQNLMYFGRLKGLRAREIKPRAERLLTGLGLWERRDETVGSYSRGMQQKVAIAAALITDPPVLLLDEPTIGLDVQAARTVKDWIAHLAADEGKTIVLTTHQLPIVQELAERIAVIRDGSVIADLPTASLLARFAEDRFDGLGYGPHWVIRPDSLVPLALIIADALGYALLMTALTLRAASIGAVVHVFNMAVMFFGGMFIPVTLFPHGIEIFARFIPTTLGTEVLNTTLSGRGLAAAWAGGTLPWLLVHVAVLAVLGWVTYLNTLRRARREGGLSPR